MKKLVLLTLVFVCLTLSAFAQGEATKGITAKGFKVGVTMANLTGDFKEFFEVDAKMKIGFAAGGFLTYSFSPTFAIQPEVLYCMKGAKADTDEGEKIKLDYIVVPILLKYSFPTEGKVAPSLFAGPEVGFLMSAKAEDEDIKDDLKSIDFGIAFGAGVDFAMETGKIMLDARYTLGMTNLPDFEEDEESDLSIKNATIMVTLGYGF